jgi:hypothetical protein
MFSLKPLFAVAFLISSALAIAAPTKSETHLAKRGAVLSAQWATETEVRSD